MKKFHMIAWPVFFCLLVWHNAIVFSQEVDSTPSVFGKLFEADDTVLKEHPEIAKAHETWKADLTKALETYHEKLGALLHREQPKGDLEFLKALESVVEKAKTEHAGPCILFDRLPSKAMPIQSELNKAKSRANKSLIVVLDKEIAAVLKEKQLDKAKAIEEFFYMLFLPKTMQAKVSEMRRFQNKVLLFVHDTKNWADAYQWCRERNADLASIHSPAEQALLYKTIKKFGRNNYAWTGGARIGTRWQWTDGTPFDFTFWAKGEPSKGQHRIGFGYNKENGAWDAGSASHRNVFIAQWTLY